MAGLPVSIESGNSQSMRRNMEKLSSDVECSVAFSAKDLKMKSAERISPKASI